MPPENLAMVAAPRSEIYAHLMVASLRSAGIPALVEATYPVVQDMTFCPRACAVWVPQSMLHNARIALGASMAPAAESHSDEWAQMRLLSEIRETYALLFVGLICIPVGLVSGPMAWRNSGRALRTYGQQSWESDALRLRLERAQSWSRNYTRVYYGLALYLMACSLFK